MTINTHHHNVDKQFGSQAADYLTSGRDLQRLVILPTSGIILVVSG